jgi:hypothetical protein
MGLLFAALVCLLWRRSSLPPVFSLLRQDLRPADIDRTVAPISAPPVAGLASDRHPLCAGFDGWGEV